MNGIKLVSVAILMGLGLTACQSVARDPLFRLTLKVIDDEGKPVPGAEARIGAERRSKEGESEGKGVFAEGVTDENGMFSGEVEAWNARRAGYRVQKEGYYGVWLSYHAKQSKAGKWQPWNPTVEVVLKRKKNPVPMYVKRISERLPALDVAVGYDLVSGDWVAPYGRGKKADMLFLGHLAQQGPNDFDWVLKVSFPAAGDGIQRFSVNPILGKEDYQRLVLYDAPEGGYASEWVLKRSRKPGQGEQTTFDSNSGYYFRVCTELDRDGKVVKARYGKIYGDFFDMVYYLNPDGTRNVEFDPKRNLFNPSGADRPEFRGLMP